MNDGQRSGPGASMQGKHDPIGGPERHACTFDGGCDCSSRGSRGSNQRAAKEGAADIVS